MLQPIDQPPDHGIAKVTIHCLDRPSVQVDDSLAWKFMPEMMAVDAAGRMVIIACHPSHMLLHSGDQAVLIQYVLLQECASGRV